MILKQGIFVSWTTITNLKKKNNVILFNTKQVKWLCDSSMCFHLNNMLSNNVLSVSHYKWNRIVMLWMILKQNILVNAGKQWRIRRENKVIRLNIKEIRWLYDKWWNLRHVGWHNAIYSAIFCHLWLQLMINSFFCIISAMLTGISIEFSTFYTNVAFMSISYIPHHASLTPAAYLDHILRYHQIHHRRASFCILPNILHHFGLQSSFHNRNLLRHHPWKLNVWNACAECWYCFHLLFWPIILTTFLVSPCN